MSRTLSLGLAAALALGGGGAAAAEGFEVSLGLEPEAMWSESRGARIDAGWFVGAGAALRGDWQAELRLLAQEFSHSDDSTWQLGVRRFFPAGRPYESFLEGGLHYATNEWDAPDASGSTRDEELGAFVGGGVDWGGERWAVRLDGRFALFEADLAGTTTDFDLTVGAVLRF